MNKSFMTNFLAIIIMLIGYFTQNSLVFTVGLFSISGAITNWLAVYMLFEKVPLLYGSGVIPARFEDFKLAIKTLMLEQFFSQENIDRFISSNNNDISINLTPVIDKIDLSPTFDNLVNVVEQSSFGGMLAMFGGTEALQPMREPFIEKMRASIVDISKSEDFNAILKTQLAQAQQMADIREKISHIIDKRLSELTPQLVKEIVQKMIREHLGWLVVWGGVFGGTIGLLASLTSTI